MALGANHKIIEDTPSEMVRVSRLELNKLIDSVDLLVAGLAGVAVIGDVATAAAAVDTTQLRKVVATIERPAPPAGPAV